MTRAGIQTELFAALHELAPEADLSAIPPGADIRERLDVDSFAMLNLMVALERRLGVTVPERDYRRLVTIDGAVEYLARKLESQEVPAKETP